MEVLLAVKKVARRQWIQLVFGAVGRKGGPSVQR